MNRSFVQMIALVMCLFTFNSISLASIYDGPHHQSGKNRSTFVLGSISEKPTKSFKRLINLGQYLELKFAEHGVFNVKVDIKVARNIEQMQSFIDLQEVDLLSETMLTAVKLEGIDIDLLRWKKGVDRYQTYFVTHRNSPIHSITDLIGHSIVMEDIASTSSYFVPMLDITQVSNAVYKKANVQQTNMPDKINYIFAASAYSHSQENLAIWTHRSLVDAAAISNLDWNNDKKFPKHLRSDLRIFHRSKPIPRSLMMTRSTLEPEMKSLINTILLDIHNDIRSKKALYRFKETKQFSRLTNAEKVVIKNARQSYLQRIKPFE